jgi:hypothetical protein
MLFKNSVRTSKRTPHFTITEINWLTLFKLKKQLTLSSLHCYSKVNFPPPLLQTPRPSFTEPWCTPWKWYCRYVTRDHLHHVAFQVLTAASMKMITFWVIAPFSLVVVDRRFRGAYCLCHLDALWWRQYASLKRRLLQWEYTAQYPRWLSSSLTPSFDSGVPPEQMVLEPQIKHRVISFSDTGVLSLPRCKDTSVCVLLPHTLFAW